MFAACELIGPFLESAGLSEIRADSSRSTESSPFSTSKNSIKSTTPSIAVRDALGEGTDVGNSQSENRGLVTFVNIWLFFALCQCSNFGVVFSRFHGVRLVPHGLLKDFVILAKRAEEGKIDLGVGHFWCAMSGVVLGVVEQFGKDVDVVLN
jgi:hypothetical protein